MLATLNDKNDPHDVIEISPDIVRASRTNKEAPTLAPEIAGRVEPKIEAAPSVATPSAATSTPSVDAAVRAALSDFQSSRKRSPIGKWLRGAMLSMLFAGGSAAAAIGWQVHGDMVQDRIAAWIPALTAAPSQATQAGAEQATQAAAEPAEPEATTEAAAPAAATPAPQQGATPVTATAPDAAPSSVQAMARDLATMGQQIEQLKANIAELKAGQEQMARELAKAPQPKPAEARAVDPRNRVSALPPRPPVAPVRKPKPVYPPSPTSYAPPPVPIAPPAQAAVVPPPPAAVQTADDDGPVVRPPMPVH